MADLADGVVGVHGVKIPGDVARSQLEGLLLHAEKGERELLESGAEWHRRTRKRLAERAERR